MKNVVAVNPTAVAIVLVCCWAYHGMVFGVFGFILLGLYETLYTMLSDPLYTMLNISLLLVAAEKDDAYSLVDRSTESFRSKKRKIL